VRPGGAVEEVALEGGPPFCITDFPWPIETVRLAAGDVLVLVTDGVTEAQDGAGRLFGRARFQGALAARAPEAIVMGLVEAVRAFEGDAPASDDLTVLALGWRN
jgi:adenylate cyclase